MIRTAPCFAAARLRPRWPATTPWPWSQETLPPCLKAVASTRDGEVMAVSHRDYPIYGVQFHPESIMTPDGRQMLINFIQEVKTND